MSTNSTVYTAVGRRKTASARVRLVDGTGTFTINGRPIEDYFKLEQFAKTAQSPLVTSEKLEQFDVLARVAGGGPHGQSTAVAHGIARALLKYDADLRSSLKQAGHLKRDPRERERKKSGQPGARKRFQFSKR